MSDHRRSHPHPLWHAVTLAMIVVLVGCLIGIIAGSCAYQSGARPPIPQEGGGISA